jgi:MFS family permease
LKYIDIIPASAPVSRGWSKVFYGWVVIFFAVFAIAVTNGILLGGMPFFYQSFISEFGWNRTTIATAGSALLVSRGLTGPFAGPLWDRYGPKRFMVIGAAVIGVALFFGSRIDAPTQLYLALLMMSLGLTFAGIGPGAYLASSWFTSKRGVAMGIVGTATSLGGMIFSPISTRLIAGYGWRNTMMIYAAFMFAVFMPLIYFFIKNRPAEIGASADPGESDWFLRRRKLIKSIAATAAIVGALIYSPMAPLLTSSFGKPTAILIFASMGIICLGALLKYFATKVEAPAAVTEAGPDRVSGATMKEAIGSGSYWALLLGSSLCYAVIFALVFQRCRSRVGLQRVVFLQPCGQVVLRIFERPLREARYESDMLPDDARRRFTYLEGRSGERLVLLPDIRTGLRRRNGDDKVGPGGTLRPTLFGQTARRYDERRDASGRRRQSVDRIPVRRHWQLSVGVQGDGRLFDCFGYLDGAAIAPGISGIFETATRKIGR